MLLQQLKIFCKAIKNLWSHHCILCQQPTNNSFDLCNECKSELPWLTKACYKCGQPLTGNINTNICGECLQNPPLFFRTIALFYYQFPIDRFILHLKFGHELWYCKLLGNMLSEHVQKIYTVENMPELLLPVPLHDKRLCERGFNQALEIAKIVAKNLCLPIDIVSFTRIKNTTAQTGLKAKDRKTNLSKAFKCVKPIQARHIAIIDDVFTTGNTVKELSTTLKTNGVKRIDIWCIARAGITN